MRFAVGTHRSLAEMNKYNARMETIPGTLAGTSASSLVAFIQDPAGMGYISYPAYNDYIAGHTESEIELLIQRIRILLADGHNASLILTNELRVSRGLSILR